MSAGAESIYTTEMKTNENIVSESCVKGKTADDDDDDVLVCNTLAAVADQVLCVHRMLCVGYTENTSVVIYGVVA